MQKRSLLLLYALVLSVVAFAVTPTGKNWRVVLPASQWTPASQWVAQVMIFNNGESYGDDFYNKVIGMPPQDIQGRQWYEPGYELTNGDFDWEEKTSPFSSDETYKGYPSTRWVVADIMADIYLRRTFTVDKGFGGDVWLSCGHDDGPAEFYINGVLVKSVSDGWNNEEIIKLLPEQRDLIKTDGSENIIAVHVHQNWGGAFADCGIYEDLTGNTVSLLPTLPEVEKWECVYYTLGSNDELNSLDPKLWAGRCVDESDWAYGYGPLSNTRDYFLISEWASSIQPLLVRRHFTLTAEQVEEMQSRKMTLSCSYDENPKVYLNGTLLRSWSGWNDNSYDIYTLTPRNKQLLREGDNVLAVSLQQGGGSGHIDYGLSVVLPYVEPTGISLSPSPTLPQGEGAVYDLQGRKVSTQSLPLCGESEEASPPVWGVGGGFSSPWGRSGGVSQLKPGVYIYNGKKIVIK